MLQASNASYRAAPRSKTDNRMGTAESRQKTEKEFHSLVLILLSSLVFLRRCPSDEFCTVGA